MRRLVLKMSISLDGFVGGPNGEIDPIFRTAADDSTEWIVDTSGRAGAHLVGSRTYYDMAAYRPHSDAPSAAPMNDIRKIVSSRNGSQDGTQVDGTTRALADASQDRGDRQSVTPTSAVLRSSARPTVVRGDLAEEVTRLTEQPGNFILAHAGARFTQCLLATGLIDEYRLVVHPVALGRGQPPFSRLRNPVDLRLISSTPFGSGVVGAVCHAA